jgi:UDP-N-acetylmuramyl pentapeptide synthase
LQADLVAILFQLQRDIAFNDINANIRRVRPVHGRMRNQKRQRFIDIDFKFTAAVIAVRCAAYAGSNLFILLSQIGEASSSCTRRRNATGRPLLQTPLLLRFCSRGSIFSS